MHKISPFFLLSKNFIKKNRKGLNYTGSVLNEQEKSSKIKEVYKFIFFQLLKGGNQIMRLAISKRDASLII